MREGTLIRGRRERPERVRERIVNSNQPFIDLDQRDGYVVATAEQRIVPGNSVNRSERTERFADRRGDRHRLGIRCERRNDGDVKRPFRNGEDLSSAEGNQGKNDDDPGHDLTIATGFFTLPA